METRHVDVAIIGAGSAGLGAYRAARAHTQSVLLIEGGPYGTTCARVGCMPSKLLIAAAEAAHHARDAAPFGINVTGEVQVDGRAVMDRVRRERDRFVGFVIESVDGIPERNRLRGYARFVAPDTLQIDNHTRVVARRIIIASGSRPQHPALLEAAGDRLVTNDDLFEWETLPESVAVFGPGVIGLELGQALHRLGVRVRLFGVGGGLGPLQDTVIRDYAERTLNEHEALYVDTDATVEGIERDGDQVVVTFIERGTGRRLTERFDYLLAATGRRPNTDRLALENADLQLDSRGVPCFNRYTMQCRTADGEPAPVFIAGDADQELPLLHEATDEGRIAGDNAGRFPEVRVGHRRAPLSIVFSDPQIATVGPSYAELEKRHGGCDCLATGEVSFESQGRSRVMRANQGLMRLYAEHGSGLFLGAEIFGPRAEHLAHLLAWSLQQRLTVSQMLDMPFYHPVIEEGLRTGLRDLNANLQLGPAILEHCMECGPGD
ncbi:dihydrolipoyl dehydrogenase [Modicisalibacter tunisiensis]|uniref:dihydrolipoyl dehydrogenase n=1 Tax=Modicisalibacter tunisiensis TaxID=390637 RepID=UPI001CCA265B|nr:dihydrolipoyl dehydrogenase [Modicisalibacter tunisiensis]MBZ9538623.1 dihydrolipoyl dehydrogenase [Modicisalibacter tunisiensis]